MDSCQLLRPDWLWLFLPLALLLWLLSQRRSKAGSWRTVCDSQLLPYILQGRETKTRRWPLFITGLAGLLAITALSGPACEQREQPVFRDQSALVVALDLSRSMDATDIKPSRLIRARLKLIDILKQRQEGQTALIVYAAQAYTVSPLTDDTNTIISLVSSLDSNMMPQQGSNTSIAIAQAARLLQQAGVPKGDILLITDGISDNNLQATLKEIKAYQHRVSVLSIGTHSGAPIALRDGGFLKNNNGAIVIPKLNEAPLQQLTQRGNGRYQSISANDADINYLLDIVSAEGETKEAVKGLNTDQWREEGPWLLLLLLPLAALAFRRGYLIIIVLLIMPMPDDAEALELNQDLQQLWLNQYQQAQQQLQQGKAEQAAEQFTNPEWKAAAHYRAAQYQQSIDALQGINNAEALYNKGNALARLGKHQEAIEAYDEALKLQPKHEDAEYNRDLIRQQQQEQNQEQEQEQEQGDESKQDSQGDDQQQGQGQQSEQQSPEKQQSQSGDLQQQDQQPSGQQQEQKDDEQQAQRQAEQDADQKEDEQQQAQQQDGEKSNAEKEQQAMPNQETSEASESDIATEQWLRRIPDDPGGLLRRKFQYQYQQQSQQPSSEIEPW